VNVQEDCRISERTALATATAVVVANYFNISIFQPFWIVKNGILREDEISSNMLVSPGVIVFPTDHFELTILPERIQMRFNPNGYATAQEDLNRVIGGIVKVLPHTPYAAMGFNYDFRISQPAGAEFAKWNRDLFVSRASSEITDASDADARFGCYVSFNSLGGRMKINILPLRESRVTATPSGTSSSETEAVHVAVNLHRDIAQPPAIDAMMGALARWEQAFDLSSKLMRKIES